MSHPIGLILLAAGGSTRMGRAKQLLPYRGEAMVRRAAREALAASCQPVVVVMGADWERLTQELCDLDVRTTVNSDWHLGMGTSLRQGVEALAVFAPDCAGVIVALCDQPHVITRTFERLIEARRTSGKPICAAEYAGTLGPPCLFAASLFGALRTLPPGGGAKGLILSRRDDVAAVPCPEAETDVDTPADYEGIR